MKKLPEIFLSSLEGAEGFDRQAFEKLHASGDQVTSLRTNPAKCTILPPSFSVSGSVPWTEYGYYLDQRPSFTFDPLFHAGCYYVQEASSMFLEQAFCQWVESSSPLKVLDLCAAPGGKSTHLQSLLTPDSLLVSNEVIKSRSLVLTDNLIKWGAQNVIITNNDPSAFKKTEGYFDVMVVDAPCSGSGLFRKDEEAIDEWSLNNVALCSQRQQRILADALPALKENGVLIYSTCSYSKEEDEEIADWLVKEMGMESLVLQLEKDWNIVRSHSQETASEGYRFYPDKTKGEGFFIAGFRKVSETKRHKLKERKSEKPTAKEKTIIQAWLKNSGMEILKDHDQFFAIPTQLTNEYSVLSSVLNIQYAGVGLGQVMKERLVPEHALALSGILAETIPVNELAYDQAIKYLQRQDLNFNSSAQGWQLVSYRGQSLGWVNVLPNRINNYYPKEMRILKQSNTSSFEK